MNNFSSDASGFRPQMPAGQVPAPRKFSSGLIAFAILQHISMFAGWFFFVVGIALASEHEAAVGGVMILLGLLGIIVGVVFSCLILHRGWSFVQDGKARTTPGKAVGFLFIPFYNLYWTFVAHYGLMQEFNRVAEARGKGRDTVVTGLALTYSIVSIIPYIGIIFGPIFLVVVLWQIIGFIRENEG